MFEGDFALQPFPNGAVLEKVQLRDLGDDREANGLLVRNPMDEDVGSIANRQRLVLSFG